MSPPWPTPYTDLSGSRLCNRPDSVSTRRMDKRPEDSEDLHQSPRDDVPTGPPTKKVVDLIDTCVICLDPISELAVAQPCQHRSFDFLCLISWLQESSSCPLCKVTVSQVFYDVRGPHDHSTYQVSPPRPVVEEGHAPLARPQLRHGRGAVGHRRRRPPRQPRSPLRQDGALEQRRRVYREQLYSLHVGSNRMSRFQNLTPQLFGVDEELVGRARKWIRRELQVFAFLNPDHVEAPASKRDGSGALRRLDNAEFLLEYIIAILKSVDLRGSGGQAEDMLAEFLGRDNSRLFIHELTAWLRSPYTSLQDWDHAVQYRVALSGPDISRDSHSPGQA